LPSNFDKVDRIVLFLEENIKLLSKKDEKRWAMLEFDLKYLRKIKIWFKKNNELILKGKDIDKKEFSSCNSGIAVNKTIIIELFIPRGGRNVYGLLGADFISAVCKNLTVSVSKGDILKTKLLSNSLAGCADMVKLCLPDDLRLSVFEELRKLSNSNNLNISGKLDFNYGAFSEISSSEWIFRKLTMLVVKLLDISEKEISSDLLNRLVDE
jgi:hypothetical protein